MRLKRYIILACIVVVGFLTACSPQRRLYNLLKRHPELRTNDSLIIRELPVYIPAASNAIPFPKIENDPCNCDSLLREALKNGLSVQAGNAQANIIPTDSGLALQANQLPDTVYLPDTIRVPEYIIKEAPRDETKGEIFFRFSGYIVWGLLAMAIIVGIIFLFLKR